MHKQTLYFLLVVSCAACSDNEILIKNQELAQQLPSHSTQEKTEQKPAAKTTEPSEADKEKYKDAAITAVEKLQNNTKTMQQLLNLWGKIYGVGLSDEELKKLEQAANQDVQATQEAVTDFTLEVAPLIEKALHNYVEELKSAKQKHKKHPAKNKASEPKRDKDY